MVFLKRVKSIKEKHVHKDNISPKEESLQDVLQMLTAHQCHHLSAIRPKETSPCFFPNPSTSIPSQPRQTM